MTQPDYREKARELWQEILRDRYLPSFPNVDKGKLIVQALEDAHLAGRREGIEEAAKVAERMYGPYWSKGYRTASVVIARDIRALLQGGKE